jgi:transcriptional regulator with PAS, ATPase and Fis domain
VSSAWANGNKGETEKAHSAPVMIGESYSLETEVLRYEANLIRQALETSGGSVTRAARMLGVTHQGLAFILNGRHKDLLSIRTPVKKRRRSIIRYH